MPALRRQLVFVTPALAVLAITGCGKGTPAGVTHDTTPATPAKTKRPQGPALCRTRLRVTVTGHVGTAAATELSGLVLSHSQPGVLWTHNDSGDSARVFAIAPGGRVLAEVTVTGAGNVDWEDIAIGADTLYLADIGDNGKQRQEIDVYRVPEPRLAGGAPAATAPAQRLALRYPDGPHDAEALLVDPSTGALVIATKDFGGTASIYVADHPTATATTTLRRVARLQLGLGQTVTGGDVSADGRIIALRTYDRAYVWPRRRGRSLASVLRGAPCSARAGLGAEGQGEAIALTRDGRAFYTVPEGTTPAIRRYAPLAFTDVEGLHTLNATGLHVIDEGKEIHAIAIAVSTLYWTNGTIFRTASL